MTGSIPPSRMIGRASYEKSFEIRFVAEEKIAPGSDYDAAVRVILSDGRYALPCNLAGRSVAVIGNGKVVESGPSIDAHDEVIRITSMRHWERSKRNDGERITIWAGHPAFVISRGADGVPQALERFVDVIRQGAGLWALSPFHISFDAYFWLHQRNLLDQLLVTPTPAAIYEMACASLPNADLAELFSIPKQRRHLRGLPNFDLLLTGTRLVLLLELLNVRNISLYGFDFFAGSTEAIWFGHDLATDLNVLLGIKRRVVEAGGRFYWHEEAAVTSAARPANP